MPSGFPPVILSTRRLAIEDALVFDVARNTVWRGPRGVRLSPPRFRLLLILCAPPRRCWRSRELSDALYFDDPDGGPLGAVECVGVHVHHLRSIIAGIGLIVPDARHTGHAFYIVDQQADERKAA
jgi:DNA-binding response OmpR family regulator